MDIGFHMGTMLWPLLQSMSFGLNTNTGPAFQPRDGSRQDCRAPATTLAHPSRIPQDDVDSYLRLSVTEALGLLEWELRLSTALSQAASRFFIRVSKRC